MNRRRLILYAEESPQAREMTSFLESLNVRVDLVPARGRPSRDLLDADGAELLVVLAKIQGESSEKMLEALRSAVPGGSLIVAASSAYGARSLRLLRNGLADHIVSADDPAALFGAVRGELLRHDLQARNVRYLRDLRRIKSEQIRSLGRAQELEDIYDATVENLMTALDVRDVETFGHSQTVAKYSEVLAKLLGIDDAVRLAHIRMGALLHDIGKIAIPDSILKKPGALSADEWEKIKLHPILGYGLVKEIKLVPEIGNIILHHHERYDGSGYPKGLAGEQVPLEARIFALADALDAITAHRPYREARDHGVAKAEIVRHRGTQFDPDVVAAFVSLASERWARIRYETTSHLPAFEEFSRLLRKVKS